MINKPVALWLYICAALVFSMAVIGAITRLTDSGLSMVEWRPLLGAIPPLNEGEWTRVFNLYKDIPEFKHNHNWMELADFKKIFFWEWLHRFLGRFIGVVYAVPFFLFLVMGRLPQKYMFSFVAFLFLGAAQGGMGWYMVQSGLVDNIDVSHYRLAAHLVLAVIIFCLLLDMALKLSVEKSDAAVHTYSLRPHIRMGFALAFLTIIWGAFVAGLKAGLIYNTFPMMGDAPWPSEGLDMTPFWINAFENHAAVQFIHRVLACLTFVTVILLWLRSGNYNLVGRPKRMFRWLAFVAVLQVMLGLSTLLTQVELYPAVMHQGGALILMGLLVAVYHETLPQSYSFDKKRKK